MNYLALILAISLSSQTSAFDFTVTGLVKLCLLVSLGGGGGGLTVVGNSSFGVALPRLVLPVLFNCLSTKLGGFFTEGAGKLAISVAKLEGFFIEEAGPMAFSGEELRVFLTEGAGTTAFSGVFESSEAVIGTLPSEFSELLFES